MFSILDSKFEIFEKGLKAYYDGDWKTARAEFKRSELPCAEVFLERMGLKVPAKHFYTSAMAAAEFLHSQNPGCTAYVIGEAALTKALYDRNIYMNY